MLQLFLQAPAATKRHRAARLLVQQVELKNPFFGYPILPLPFWLPLDTKKLPTEKFADEIELMTLTIRQCTQEPGCAMTHGFVPQKSYG
jgi:hypothetical protein